MERRADRPRIFRRSVTRQAILSQWSRPWFGATPPNHVWLALLNSVRAPSALRAFRLHVLFAFVEVAVARARQAAPQAGSPFRRLNRLWLTQWTDAAGDSRTGAVLRAATDIAYSDNSFQERHSLVAELNGPFLRLTISLEVPGTPPSQLTRYTADEVRDQHGNYLYGRP